MNRFATIIFWSLVTLLLFVVFGLQTKEYSYTFYFLSFFMPIVISTSWVFNDILIPRFLLRKKYGLFVLYFFYVLIISVNLEFILVFVAFTLIGFYDSEKLALIMESYKFMPLIMYLIVFFSAFISLSAELLKKQSIKSQDSVLDYIEIRSERKNRRVYYNEICYVESMSDYVRIFLISGETISSREKISHLIQLLPSDFHRIHRSYLVNGSRIDSYTREIVTILGKELPISRTYKQEFLERITGN